MDRREDERAEHALDLDLTQAEGTKLRQAHDRRAQIRQRRLGFGSTLAATGCSK